ncbi:MAG: serine protease, partial [Candidatus Eremiobacteraeota bacterium]|nr:serine protease [Candidatus Eremiobacteraeota bacterium]
MKHLPITSTDVFRPLPPFDRPPSTPPSPRSGRLKALVAGLALIVAAGCAASGAGSHIPGGRPGQNIARALPAVSPTPDPAGEAKCDGDGKNAGCDVKKNPNTGVTKTPGSGLTPADLRSAYGLPPVAASATANGPLIAIVDAFELKSAESDLAVYRAQFGLPPCTTKNHCFTKVMMEGSNGSNGESKKKNAGIALTTWADEIALDLAMASAACPTCRLLLVEAGAQDLDSLAEAVNIAASYHPASISNSWGVLEGGGNAANIDPEAQAAFNHPGIAITASAGDSGAVQFPASSPYVTSVGGTTLSRDPSAARGWSETAWAQTGTGCSIMFAV